MTHSDFDDVVVGNGLLGAAVALELVRLGRRVGLIGAKQGASGGRGFSGHFDDSRMLRLYHADDYWEAMTRLNLPLLRAVQAQARVPCFTPTPVRLRFDVAGSRGSTLPRHTVPGNRLLDALDREDEGGGIINPMAYIAAMNAQAQSLGLVQRHATVLDVVEAAGRCQVVTDQGSFTSTRVFHACGFHAAEAVNGLQVIGKVVLFAHRPHAATGPVECFVDAQSGSTVFSDVYGFCDYRQAPEGIVTKIGFTEVSPVLLEPSQVSAWFTGTCHRHPLLEQMYAWVHEWHAGFATEIRVEPCAFAVTQDRRPSLRQSGSQFWLVGCNGMAAKCCQAVAQSAVAAVDPASLPDFPAELRMTPEALHA